MEIKWMRYRKQNRHDNKRYELKAIENKKKSINRMNRKQRKSRKERNEKWNEKREGII